MTIKVTPEQEQEGRELQKNSRRFENSQPQKPKPSQQGYEQEVLTLYLNINCFTALHH